MSEATVAELGRLVLSRKKGERIKIGEDVWITVHEIRGDKARVMIEAPRNVPILREECLPPEERYDVVVRGNSPVETTDTEIVEAEATEIVPSQRKTA